MKHTHKNCYRIFVAGIPSRIPRKKLQTFFSEIMTSFHSMELPRLNPKSKSSRNKGFAILHLNCKEEWHRMIELQFLDLEDRKLTLREYLQGNQLSSAKKRQECRKVYLSNLSQKLSLDLANKELQKSFGPVEDLFRLWNPITKKVKNCACCFFESEQDAKDAITAGYVMVGDEKVLIKVFDKEEQPKFMKNIKEKEENGKKEEKNEKKEIILKKPEETQKISGKKARSRKRAQKHQERLKAAAEKLKKEEEEKANLEKEERKEIEIQKAETTGEDSISMEGESKLSEDENWPNKTNSEEVNTSVRSGSDPVTYFKIAESKFFTQKYWRSFELKSVTSKPTKEQRNLLEELWGEDLKEEARFGSLDVFC